MLDVQYNLRSLLPCELPIDAEAAFIVDLTGMTPAEQLSKQLAERTAWHRNAVSENRLRRVSILARSECAAKAAKRD